MVKNRLFKGANDDNLISNIRSYKIENDKAFTSNEKSNKNNLLNEIISKRIKTSNTNHTSENSVAASNINTDQPLTSKSITVEERQSNNSHVKKNMLYLSKSLESNGLTNKTPEVKISGLNFQQKHKKEEKSICSSDWALSPLSPPSPTNSKLKIKRKKKDNQIQPSSPVIQISKDSLASSSTETQPESQCIVSRTRSVEIPLVQHENEPRLISIRNDLKSTSIENDTLQHMKNLDLNNELENSNKSTKTPFDGLLINKNNLNLNDINLREQLWTMLFKHTPTDELIQRFGDQLHDKISFWDIVQLKLKNSSQNHLSTIYEIIDDYTRLYTNMSSLLERFANEQTLNNLSSNSNKKVSLNVF